MIEMKRTNASNTAALNSQREFNTEVLSRIEAQQTQQNEHMKMLNQSVASAAHAVGMATALAGNFASAAAV